MSRYRRYRRRKNNSPLIDIIIFFIFLMLSPIILIIYLIKVIYKSTSKNKFIEQSDAIDSYEDKHNYIYYDEDDDEPKYLDLEKENITSKYHIKDKTISDCEMYFYNIIKKHFGEKYDIRVQVPLSSVIEKEKDFERQYQNELYRSIDIGIFDIKTTAPLLLIEINDRTHHNKDRKVRDSKVKEICNQAGLTLLTFWTEYSNTENYIIKRIRENLER